jgi:Family of unknown function (DUF5977)
MKLKTNKSIVLALPLLWLLATTTVNGQTNNPSPNGGGGMFKPDNSQFAKMAEILPPAPDATAIAKFGGVDIDLNTGTINKSITLGSLANKAISVSVGLSYASNGLKVNEYPSRAGMGWALQAGGQISRVIHGKDDLLSQRYVPNFTIMPNDENPDLSTYCYQLNNDDGKDSEPDMFSFSVGNFNGRFVFDHEGNITLLEAAPLKIQYNTQTAIDNTWNFLIITPDGVKYYFGGPAAKESTKFGSSLQYNFYITNVWCLNKIVHPNGYFITFSYEKRLIDPYLTGVEQTHYKLAPDADVPLCTPPDGGGNIQCLIGSFATVYDHATYMSANVVILKEITNSDGAKVTLSYSADNYPEKVIKLLCYYNEQGKRTAKYSFDYTIVQTNTGQSLPFLSKIAEWGSGDVLLSTGHQFEYYNTNNIPTRVSNFGQDHWGYFNGKPNATLVPVPADDEIAVRFPASTANRDADPAYAVNGLLAKIVYPTGGKDDIEYEANIQEEQKDVNPYAAAEQVLIGASAGWSAETAGAAFTVSYEPKIKITTGCEYIGTSGYDAAHDGGRIRIVNLVTNAVVYDKYIKPQAYNNIEFNNIAPGSYKIYVSCRGVAIKTSGIVKYRMGAAPDMQQVHTPVGGMRVKRTITADNVAGKAMVKRYYYGGLASLNYSSAMPVPVPRYYVAFDYTVAFLEAVNCNATIKTYQHQALNYSSINNLYMSDGKMVKYNTVTESLGGDDFESGAIEHQFNNILDIPAQPIRGWYNLDASLTNSSYISKGEVATNTYSKRGGSLVLQSAVGSDVVVDARLFKELNCVNVFAAIKLPCAGFNAAGQVIQPYPLNHKLYHVNRYYITTVWKYLAKQTIKRYDDNGQNPVTAITSYYYDDERNMMLSRTETTSSSGELLKQETKYPHDFAAPANVYADMVSRNMLATPVQVKTYRDGQLLLTQTENYDNNWFADKHLVAQSHAQVQKPGFANEVMHRYYQYDTYGNTLEFAKENDKKQATIWDDNGNNMLAKAINAGSNAIAATSFEVGAKGNFTYSGLPVANAGSPTGIRAYSLGNGPVSKSGLPAGTYIASWWLKNGSGTSTANGSMGSSIITKNGWTLYEATLAAATTAVTIAGNGTIDELRLYPQGALITTFTYEPQVGITSQCNALHAITYYEYDAFNRLVLVKDIDKNIIKKVCYNYAGMAENCLTQSFYNTAISQSFTRSNCPAGYAGSQVMYSVAAGAYSSSISQADADAKAQSDMAANGQANANATGTCTMACTVATCGGVHKKCVAGVCETGIKIYTSSVFNTALSKYDCYYHYEWSDGSWSANYYELSLTACMLITGGD